MSKMHYFSNKFSKFAKRWELSALSAPQSSILVTWSYVIWPSCGFTNWLWRNRTFKKSDKRLFQWHHCNYVTEKRHQTKVTRSFNFGLLPIKISGYASALIEFLKRTLPTYRTFDLKLEQNVPYRVWVKNVCTTYQYLVMFTVPFQRYVL